MKCKYLQQLTYPNWEISDWKKASCIDVTSYVNKSLHDNNIKHKHTSKYNSYVKHLEFRQIPALEHIINWANNLEHSLVFHGAFITPYGSTVIHYYLE